MTPSKSLKVTPPVFVIMGLLLLSFMVSPLWAMPLYAPGVYAPGELSGTQIYLRDNPPPYDEGHHMLHLEYEIITLYRKLQFVDTQDVTFWKAPFLSEASPAQLATRRLTIKDKFIKKIKAAQRGYFLSCQRQGVTPKQLPYPPPPHWTQSELQMTSIPYRPEQRLSWGGAPSQAAAAAPSIGRLPLLHNQPPKLDQLLQTLMPPIGLTPQELIERTGKTWPSLGQNALLEKALQDTLGAAAGAPPAPAPSPEPRGAAPAAPAPRAIPIPPQAAAPSVPYAEPVAPQGVPPQGTAATGRGRGYGAIGRGRGYAVPSYVPTRVDPTPRGPGFSYLEMMTSSAGGYQNIPSAQVRGYQKLPEATEGPPPILSLGHYAEPQAAGAAEAAEAPPNGPIGTYCKQDYDYHYERSNMDPSTYYGGAKFNQLNNLPHDPALYYDVPRRRGSNVPRRRGS